MPVTARKKAQSRRKRIKTGVSVVAKKSQRAKTARISRLPRSSGKTAWQKQAKKEVSWVRKLVGRLLTLVIIAGILVWFAFHYLVPRWAFSSSRPQNLLLIPSSQEQTAEVLILAHFDPDQEKHALYLIDGRETVNPIGDYGELPLQDIYRTLKLDKKADQFILATFNHALGIVVDKVLTIDSLTPETINRGETFSVFYQAARQDPKLAQDYLKLYFLTSQLSTDLTILNLTELSKVLSAYQTLGATTAHNCPVAVINTTNTKDLAGNVSNIIEENGALVVRVTNNSSKFTTSSLYVGAESAETCQPLTELITGLFPSKIQQIPANKILTDRYRAQLILFLGEDAAEIFATAPTATP